MGFLIGLMTAILLLDCLLLIFLVLLQLPKKEAGAGLAFGAGTTDALFGAGSGTILTRITKYSAGVFFALALILSAIRTYNHTKPVSEFEKELQGGSSKAPVVAPVSPAVAPAQTPVTTSNMIVPPGTNSILLSTPAEAPAPTSPPPAATTNK